MVLGGLDQLSRFINGSDYRNIHIDNTRQKAIRARG